MNFNFGRSDVSCTVFVPWDCQKNCKYCITKKLYGKHSDYKLPSPKNTNIYFDKITEQTDKLKGLNLNLTFTGGELLLFPEKLAELNERIKGNFRYSYVNTYMPKQFLENESNKNYFHINNFDGFTISIEQDHIEESNYLKTPKSMEFLKQLAKKQSARISVVILDNSPFKLVELLEFLLPFSDIGYKICLRADFAKIEKENVHKVLTDETFLNLHSICDEYLGHNGCLICRNDEFIYNSTNISYHRGSLNTSYKIGGKTITNDLIIDLDQNLRTDWESSDENVISKPTKVSKKVSKNKEPTFSIPPVSCSPNPCYREPMYTGRCGGGSGGCRG